MNQKEIRDLLSPYSQTLRSTLAGSPEHQRALAECNAVIQHIFRSVGRVLHNDNGREIVGIEVLSGYDHIITYRG